MLHVHLTVAYRSTNAITSLAQFFAKLDSIPAEQLGSDVEGRKPVVFDVGKDEVQFKKALERCHELMGNNVTLLYEGPGTNLPGSMVDNCKSYGKTFGGLWECYNVNNFYGWEAEKVVAVTSGSGATLEEVTRARTQLILILVESEHEEGYPDYQKYFQNAARQGLIEFFVMKREGQEYFDKLGSQFKVMLATIEEQEKGISSLEMEIQEKEKKCCVLS